MNKTKVLGYITGLTSVAWTVFLISSGQIVLAVVFFCLGVMTLELADRL